MRWNVYILGYHSCQIFTSLPIFATVNNMLETPQEQCNPYHSWKSLEDHQGLVTWVCWSLRSTSLPAGATGCPRCCCTEGGRPPLCCRACCMQHSLRLSGCRTGQSPPKKCPGPSSPAVFSQPFQRTETPQIQSSGGSQAFVVSVTNSYEHPSTMWRWLCPIYCFFIFLM